MVKKMINVKSFQHYHVFVKIKNKAVVGGKKYYINLINEVNFTY